jgi:hypothetical protein
MTWNFSIDTIPRGRIEKRTRTVKGRNGDPDKTTEISVFIEEPIWAATRNNEVVKAHFLPPDGKHRPEGRWVPLATGEQPIAWMPYIKPEHPFAGRTVPFTKHETDPAKIAAMVPMIEDVGGGL